MTRPRDPEAGLTLIEVLVVLALVGVMAGVTVLGLGGLDRGVRAEAEAVRLADRLQLASDEALVSSAVLAPIWDAGGYRFDRWDAAAGAWRRSDQRLLGPRHSLPAALRLQRGDGTGTPPVLIAPDLQRPAIEFVITGSAMPWAVAYDGFAAAASPLRGQDG